MSHLVSQLQPAVHGCCRVFLRATCAPGCRCLRSSLLGQLVGVQVPADVRVRLEDRERWAHVERRHQPSSGWSHPHAVHHDPQ